MKKLNGSALLESMIALVVIVCCMSMTFMIYASVMRADNSRQRLHALLTLKNKAIEMRKTNSYDAGEELDGNFRIVKEIEPFELSGNVFVLKLSCIGSAGDTIDVYHELIRISDI